MYGGNPQVRGAGVKENFKELRWSPNANLSIVRHLCPKWDYVVSSCISWLHRAEYTVVTCYLHLGHRSWAPHSPHSWGETLLQGWTEISSCTLRTGLAPPAAAWPTSLSSGESCTDKLAPLAPHKACSTCIVSADLEAQAFYIEYVRPRNLS